METHTTLKTFLASPNTIFETARRIRWLLPRPMSSRRPLPHLQLPRSLRLLRHPHHPEQAHLEVDAWIVTCDRCRWLPYQVYSPWLLLGPVCLYPRSPGSTRAREPAA
jgi:hypothetical protein